MQHDVVRRDRRIGTPPATRRARVGAEVSKVDRLVDVRGAAVAAVLGVRRVLHLRDCQRPILDPEVRDRAALPAEIGDQRVVGVERQRGRGRQCRHHRRPAVGDRLQLAVAIELVAEQVAEQHASRLERGHDRVHPELVDLEQAELPVDLATPAGGIQQRRRDATGHVGAGAIGDHPAALAPEDRGDHRRRRRLPVGRRDHRRAVGQSRGQTSDRVGRQTREQLARQAGAAATAGASRQPSDGPRRGDLRVERAHADAAAIVGPGVPAPPAGTIVCTAAGSTSISAGSSAIGSPSA